MRARGPGRSRSPPLRGRISSMLRQTIEIDRTRLVVDDFERASILENQPPIVVAVP